MEKKHVIILSIIGIITIVSAIAGITFAYLSTVVTPGSNIKESIIETRNYSTTITYDHDGEIRLVNAIPGTTDIMNVEIYNGDPTESVSYNLYWEKVENTFDNSLQDVIYSVSCTSNGTDKIEKSLTNQLVPESTTTSQNIITDITLPAGVTHTCSVKIDYLSLDVIQNNNMNKTFAGTIKVGLN